METDPDSFQVEIESEKVRLPLQGNEAPAKILAIAFRRLIFESLSAL